MGAILLISKVERHSPRFALAEKGKRRRCGRISGRSRLEHRAFVRYNELATVQVKKARLIRTDTLHVLGVGKNRADILHGVEPQLGDAIEGDRRHPREFHRDRVLLNIAPDLRFDDLDGREKVGVNFTVVVHELRMGECRVTAQENSELDHGLPGGLGGIAFLCVYIVYLISLGKVPMERPNPYHHGDLRRALLQNALEMLDADGAGALSLRALACRVGVTPMATYRHFPDKEALLAAVAARGFEHLRETGLRADAGEAPGRALVAQTVNDVRIVHTQPGLFRLMFGPPPTERPPALRDAEAASIAVLTERIAIERPSVPDPEAWTLAAWSVVHGLAFLILDGRLDGLSLGGVDETVARVAEAILKEAKS